jgi:hypothetical protein
MQNRVSSAAWFWVNEVYVLDRCGAKEAVGSVQKAAGGQRDAVNKVAMECVAFGDSFDRQTPSRAVVQQQPIGIARQQASFP